MLTIDDVQTIPLFSTLAATELERLAQTSADLHLGIGEFAVPEGGERALFAVLAGKIEVVKLVDGVERRLGWRSRVPFSAKCPSLLACRFRAAIVQQSPHALCEWMFGSIMPLRPHRQRSL